MPETASCACGSGLRRVRCCGLDAGALPDAASLALLDAQGAKATRLFNEKKRPEAEALALKLLDLAPNHRLPLRVLFEIRKSENKMPAAEALARRLAALPGPHGGVESAANMQLAQLIIAQGRFAEAETAARKAVIATPRDASAHHVMGVVLTETGRLKGGERHYRKAASLLGRDDGMVLGNTAWNLKLQGRLDEAAEIYEKALVLRPDNSRAVGGYAQVEMARGHAAKAASLLDDGLRRWPNDRTLRLLRALVDLATGNAAAVLTRLSEAPEALLPAELAARGQALARQGEPVAAVSLFALAKKMQRERYGHAYLPNEFIAKSDIYKSYFTADKLAAIPRAQAISGPTPVFLLGFPGSGTTLLEQFMAQATGFAAGDEQNQVAGLVDAVPALAGASAVPYPQALDDAMIGAGLDLPEALRSRYLQAGPSGARFVTDRAAANPWHLGLIKLLFPDTPVIHLLRHPLDVMLSNFSRESRLEADCGVSLASMARHYDLVMSMIAHYRGQLALRYMPVRYEELVSAPRATIKRILDFIGADGTAPAEADLRANHAPPPARVPAHYTVREALHQRGLYRYRDYEALMPNLFTEIRPVLAPWIETLGYEP